MSIASDDVIEKIIVFLKFGFSKKFIAVYRPITNNDIKTISLLL